MAYSKIIMGFVERTFALLHGRFVVVVVGDIAISSNDVISDDEDY